MLSAVAALVGCSISFVLENGIYALLQLSILLLFSMLSYIPSMLHYAFVITLGGINALPDYLSSIQTVLSWPVIVFDIFARFPILLLPVLYYIARRYPKRQLASWAFKATARSVLFVLDLFLRGISVALEYVERKLTCKPKKMAKPRSSSPHNNNNGSPNVKPCM